MKAAALALAALLAASAASAQSFAEAKKRAGGMQSAQGRAVQQTLGRVAVGSKYSRSALKSAEDWLLQPEPQAKAVAFVNHEGCALVHGQLLPLNAAAWQIAVKQTAANTEIVYLTSLEMRRVTGNAMAAAVGINKEMRQYYESQMGVHFSAPAGKNILGLRVGMDENMRARLPGPNDQADQDGVGALRLAHELMHIVLRQFGNENIGGGSKLASTDQDVANAHHEFICTLPGWCQFNQGWQAWDGSTSDQCAQNAEAAQKHNAAFLQAMQGGGHAGR